MFVKFLIGAVTVASAFGAKIPDDTQKIPDFIKICNRNDPLLNECVKNSVEEIRPYLKNGIAELNIPPCEPLIIPELVINQGKGSVAVQSKYTNLNVYGPTDFKLHQVKVDMDKYKVKIKLTIPKLEVIGNYTITGKVLMLPISGSGICQGNYSDIDATALMQGEKIYKNNQTYVHVKEFFIDFNIGHASVHLSNLFQGDNQLGDAMNQFLNENWKTVAEEIKPALEKTIADLFKKYCNEIYGKYPIDLLLPE